MGRTAGQKFSTERGVRSEGRKSQAVNPTPQRNQRDGRRTEALTNPYTGGALGRILLPEALVGARSTRSAAVH